MRIAKEGLPQIALASVACTIIGVAAWWLWWPTLVIPIAIWIWAIAFFRDPVRVPNAKAGEFCAPADGTITEVTEISDWPHADGRAIRIGMFLSLFNVHINRAPCTGQVRSVAYRRGRFLDARHPESGARNESNTLLIDPEPPLSGPVEVRQVAGFLARRIVCHARPGSKLTLGERFGLIKFGSRTELIVPRLEETEILVGVGDKVRAGKDILVRQQLTGVQRSSGSRTEEQIRNGVSSVETART